LISVCSPLQAHLPTALALGSFDGLHAGHRSVIKTITSSNLGIPTVVSFWPHPREVLFGETRLRLDLPSEKAVLLEPLGVKQLVLVPFDLSLASLSAKEFFDQVLIKQLQAKHISIGANFRFGKNREGDPAILSKLGRESNVEVSVGKIIEDDQGRMSSSRIRSALRAGDLKITNILLGREYSFCGSVVSGKGLGKEIGWPTANLEVDARKLLPGPGVYAAFAKDADTDVFFPAVMNLGLQPTVDPSAHSATEVHFINQKLNLEKKDLVVKPIERIRGQKKFANVQDLSNQINLDAKRALSILT